MKREISQEMRAAAEAQIKNLQKQIEYDTKDYTLELLISKFKKGDFFIPKYQREFVWKAKNRSLFIESVILGLPIPFMFFAGCEDGRLEIIDGAQRIQTIIEFAENKLKLSNLKKLTSLNGFMFGDLSKAQQRKFQNRTFRVVVLDEKTTDDVRSDLFNRINTTGVKATDSEIRRGSFSGRLTRFIETCCNNPDFISLCPISDSKSQRQERFELTLRFFAYLYNYKSFVHDVNSFLDEFLSNNQDTFNEELYKEDFHRMLAFVKHNFENGFAKTKNSKSTPRVRFEAISVGVALALKEKPELLSETVDTSWLNSDAFKEWTTSDASNNQAKLRGRIEYVRDTLLGKLT